MREVYKFVPTNESAMVLQEAVIPTNMNKVYLMCLRQGTDEFRFIWVSEKTKDEMMGLTISDDDLPF